MVPCDWYYGCRSSLAQQRSFKLPDNLVDESGTSPMVPSRCERGTTAIMIMTCGTLLPCYHEQRGPALAAPLASGCRASQVVLPEQLDVADGACAAWGRASMSTDGPSPVCPVGAMPLGDMGTNMGKDDHSPKI